MLHEGPVPGFDPGGWRLRVWGACQREVELDWPHFRELPRTCCPGDFHCVESWSRMEMAWEGVAPGELLALAGPLPSAKHVVVHCFDAVGYTTNLALEDLLRPGSLLATHAEGEELAPVHGGPVRLVVPHLYAWKSAKWVCGLELLEQPRLGFWEQRGYHERGDPWREQRYSRPEGRDARRWFRKR